MNPEDLEIEEYRSLRNSIDMHMKLIPEIFTIMVAATTALLGYGISSKSAEVFLLPLLIIWPCAVLILAQMSEVMFKGAYLKKRYEQRFLGWESTLFRYRQLREKKQKPLFGKAAEDARAYVPIIDFLILICFVGFFGISGFISMIQTISDFSCSFALVLVIVAIVLWYIVAWITYLLNKGMMEVYTSEKEEIILNRLDEVFKSNEKS